MRLHLVDGTFELFRAHFSKRPRHTSPQGKDLKGTVGVVSSMLTLLEDVDEAPTHLAVAFDRPIRSFRNNLYAGYKTEAGVPPELMAQLNDVEEGAAALGLVCWPMDEFEADDALATAATRFKKHKSVEQVRVLTPDKDLGQCLDGERVVQVDRIRQKLITEASQLQDKGLRPEQVPDFLALVGDSADGIPGLKGWGKTGVTALLKVYGSLERIPTDASKWTVAVRGADGLAQTLKERQAEARLFKQLTTLRFDVPLQESLEDLKWRGVPKERFKAWCAKVGSSTLPRRVKQWRD